MNNKTKAKIFSRLIFYLTFIMLWIILDVDFNDFPNSIFKIAISGALAWILSPRINHFKTQSGDKLQLKWVFSKKVFVL